MADGLDISAFDDYIKDMVGFANDTMPKESKKFIKKQAGKLNTKNKSAYRSKGIGEKTGNLSAGFKSGKPYKYLGEIWSCRAYNGSPHAHLLNDGWIHKSSSGSESFVPGFHFMEDAASAFESGYYSDCETFVEQVVEEGL